MKLWRFFTRRRLDMTNTFARSFVRSLLAAAAGDTTDGEIRQDFDKMMDKTSRP